MNLRHLFIFSVAMGLSQAVQASDFGGYIPGTTGLKGGTMPGPGLYPISFEFVYRATDCRDEHGQRVTQVQGQKFSAKAEAAISAIGLCYVSDFKVFGANYSVRVGDLSAEAEVDRHVGPIHIQQRQAGNVNVFVEPLNLSWHLPRFDLFTSYGFYAPAGSFRSVENDPSSASDRWSHLISGGMTAYLDESKKWGLSIVPRYQISQHNMHEDFKAGQEAIFEWGISRTFMLACREQMPRFIVDVGPIGYGAYKTTSDEAIGVTNFAHSRVYGAGVEATVTIPGLQCARFCLRFEQEFLAQSRQQGKMGILRFSVKF